MIKKRFEQVLYSTTKANKCYQWIIDVSESQEGYGLVTTIHGLIDGKKTSSTKTIKKGKNIGKINETTPFEQGLSEAKSKIQSKLDEGYVYTIEASSDKLAFSLKPMLAVSFDKQSKKIEYPCFAQPKLDGIRCLARKQNGKVVLYSRGGKILNVVTHINTLLVDILEEGECTDGELYVHGWEFQRIISAIKKLSNDTPLIEYHIYDFPNVENLEEPFYKRFRGTRKRKINDFNSNIKCVDTEMINNLEELLKYEEHNVLLNYEGIMVRNSNSPYLFGYRSYDLQKVKRFEDAEFEIVGITEGVSIEEGCAIFSCITEEGNIFSVRPTGTHEERKRLYNIKEHLIGKRLTVKFQGRSTDNVPRFPVGLHFRERWDTGGN